MRADAHLLLQYLCLAPFVRTLSVDICNAFSAALAWGC